MILDGPIDSYWIENMSSIMDDTKILILENGERILIPKQVITSRNDILYHLEIRIINI